MTSRPGCVHVVGAGLAGLSAAVALADRGVRVVLSEAARQAGGRCRSYHDGQLGMVIDNGNHLVLSGNPAVGRYLRAIGAEDRIMGPATAAFPFFDVAARRTWTLRPNDGLLPWWILDAKRRVPATRPSDYLAIASLIRRHPGRRIDEVLPCRGVLWEKFLRPLLVSVLNTPPEDASADLAGAVMRETFAKGGRSIQPRVATPSLAAAFVDPALQHLARSGADVRLGRRLAALKLKDGKVAGLAFADGEEELGPHDRIILAVPPWTAQELLPGLVAPDAFCAIVNAHFKSVPPAGTPLITGLIGGTAEWVFAFDDRLSVTVSAADRLIDTDTQALADLLWQDVAAVHDLPRTTPPCRIVKEKRATFAATPAQEVRRPASATRWSNLFLAGDWTATGLPATIEGALRSGERAAALVSS
ncbi:MAG: FAD-dependent oxidoreductase [Reyranella sp.]|uniref:hydroxysqualene dehydroxylase HpnE n=1 Tax=Reyranella sp. TaxID=1929291 RepID=UPI001AD44893|nr:hydroxysqualene dehydroxylase HpnE [Reyranella sp.]MBN9086569.1 FAD-dependent oxidoreductase [Reyranella sp.]